MSLVRHGTTIALAATFALVPMLPAAPALASTSSQGFPMSGGSPFGAGGMSWGGMGGGMGGGGRTAAALPRGCESGRPMAPSQALQDLPRVTVEIYDGLFVPTSLTVRPGTVVVFHNAGQKPHTATSWDNWNSGVLHPGDSCAIWAVTPGTYPFLSIVAADGGAITGVLTVGGDPIGGGAAAAPAPGGTMSPGGTMAPSGTGTTMAPGGSMAPSGTGTGTAPMQSPSGPQTP